MSQKHYRSGLEKCDLVHLSLGHWSFKTTVSRKLLLRKGAKNYSCQPLPAAGQAAWVKLFQRGRDAPALVLFKDVRLYRSTLHIRIRLGLHILRLSCQNSWNVLCSR